MDRAQPVQARTTVVRLVRLWLRRAGVTRQRLADQLELSYDQLYHRYLRADRSAPPAPQLDVALVRFFAEQDPPSRRCAAAEAAQFCAAVGLDLSGYQTIFATAGLDRAAFRAAVAAQTGIVIGAAEIAGPAVVSAEAQRLAAARALLAQLPTDPNLPLPLPGQLAAGSRLPHPFNPLFTGRVGALYDLAERIRSGSPREVIVISGIGGVGKSNLASMFAHHFGPFFAGGVFWVDCARPQVLSAEVIACGMGGLVEPTRWHSLQPHEQERCVREHWSRPVPQLLILDACEDPEIVRQLRPTYGGARLVLTSRRTRWSAAQGISVLPLAEFGQQESVALLRRYRPDLAQDHPALTRIARTLGGLPLALHLAGSYLTQTFDSVASDPQRLADALQAADLFAHPALRGEGVEETATGHALHLAQTLDVSVQQIAGPDDRETRAVFIQYGFLAPGAVIPAWLSSQPPATQQAVIRRLVQLGLVSDRRPGVALHPLVAAYARQLDPSGQARATIERLLVSLGHAALRSGDLERQQLLQPQIQHCAAVSAGRSDRGAVALRHLHAQFRAALSAL